MTESPGPTPQTVIATAEASKQRIEQAAREIESAVVEVVDKLRRLSHQSLPPELAPLMAQAQIDEEPDALNAFNRALQILTNAENQTDDRTNFKPGIVAQASATLLDWWTLRRGNQTAPEAVRESVEMSVQTSQEFDTLLQAACDGEKGKRWKSNPQAGTRSYTSRKGPHLVELGLTPEEHDDGLDVSYLEWLTSQQDADCAFALLYVSNTLVPTSPLPEHAYAGGWISLDDVLEKVYGKPRSTAERTERRRHVWDYLRFGARANVRGKRSGVYHDPDTGEKIETHVDGPLWAFMDRERPIQMHLFPSTEVPVRVELVVSKDWTRLTQTPEIAQFLPMGELLGAIPPNQPSGAWARVIGLALANFWRRNPREATTGTLRPTRRELLDRYTPRVNPPAEVLAGDNPRRAIDCWHGALEHLVANGYVARHGETTLTLKQARDRVPRQNWQDAWLDEPVDIQPGLQMLPAIEARIAARPEQKPRQLQRPKTTRKKRPKNDAGRE